MTQSFKEILQMLKEREIADLKSKEIKRLIKEVNQETDGLERHEADCFAGLLCGNGEESEHDTI